jgi:hypothetical protein
MHVFEFTPQRSYLQPAATGWHPSPPPGSNPQTTETLEDPQHETGTQAAGWLQDIHSVAVPLLSASKLHSTASNAGTAQAQQASRACEYCHETRGCWHASGLLVTAQE